MDAHLAVAHAISDNFDILEALPTLSRVPIEELEHRITVNIGTLHKRMCLVVEMFGETYIKAGDANGLATQCLKHGVKVPSDMLLKMCEQIVNDMGREAKPVAQFPVWNKAVESSPGIMEVPRGIVWYVKMTVKK